MPSEARPGDPLAPFDHVRPTDDSLNSGVYRVVGTTDEHVTLLRVADADGRRRHTGDLVTVASAARSSLEPADNPDEHRPFADAVAGRLDGFWWSLRVLGRTVVERPIPGTAAAALVVVGLFGDPYVPIPDYGDAALFIAGAVTLVFLSRR